MIKPSAQCGGHLKISLALRISSIYTDDFKMRVGVKDNKKSLN